MSRLGVADDERERACRSAAQQEVQILELAALALVTHPHPIPRVPAARPMKQKKAARCAPRILLVQRLDALAGERQQSFVVGQRLFGRVAEISQQAEVDVVVAVGEKAHFKSLDQLVHVLRR